MELTPEEVRILGVLVEKEATTPDHYPLSTNALTNACNQKTSRDPVVDYDQRTVSDTMLLLRPAGLARTVISGRTEKHRHVIGEAWELDHASLAVLAVLMLRGPQSPGELRTRTERAHGFDDLEAVEAVLVELAGRGDPFVRNLGRGPGQSQDRWTHLLGSSAGSPAVVEAPYVPTSQRMVEPASASVTVTDHDSSTHYSNSDRSSGGSQAVVELEARIAQLEARMAALEHELGL